MINQDQLTEDWVKGISGEYKADPILVEKVIRALLLLEGLVKQNLDFVPDDGDPVYVQVPSVEDLLGDKLTAFAPNTTGIPYFKGDDSMSMEIIKQLYDIGNLFDVTEDLKTVKDTFQKFSVAELTYHETDGLTSRDVLEDAFQTSLSIATRGKSGDANILELQQGIKRVRSFIHSENYQLKKAITHATKAAYLATLLEYDADTIERFDSSTNMNDWIIEQPFNTRVNKLKKSNPEAFFYWYKMYEMSKS